MTSTFKLPHIGNHEDALQVFDKMLLRQPLPSVSQFNQVIGVVVKTRHYSTALSLFKQMNSFSIASRIYTINMCINCYCHLNQVSNCLHFLPPFSNKNVHLKFPLTTLLSMDLLSVIEFLKHLSCLKNDLKKKFVSRVKLHMGQS